MSAHIAVVIPYFQRTRGVLARTLNAVFAQAVNAGIEVIIADDESPISAASELAGLSAKDRARVRVVERRNGGPAAARNTALASVGADTDFIALLDSDDIWQPSHLRRATAAFALGYDYYFSDHCREGRPDSRFSGAGLKREDHLLIDPGNDLYAWRTDFFDTLLRAPIVGMSNIVFRRAALPKIRFNEAVDIVDDWYFHLQIAQTVKRIAFSPAVDVVCMQAENLSVYSDWRSNKSLRMIVAFSLFYRRVMRDFPLSTEQRSFVRRRWRETRRTFATTVMAMIAFGVPVESKLVGRLLRHDPLALGYFPLVTADKVARLMGVWAQFAREASWDLRAGRLVGLKMLAARLTRTIVDVRGVRVRVDRSLSYEVVKSLVMRHYEAPERGLIENALQTSDVVLELGGGLGYISALCAKLTDSTRVFVYEANPGMERLIRDTYSLNGVNPTLRICMAGRHAGTAAFHVSPDFIVSSTLPIAGANETVTVEVVALRDELERIKPTVLIVDIEGGEYELFRDFPANPCRLIMLELHPKVLGEERAAKVLHWIEAMGFYLNASIQDSYLFQRTGEQSALVPPR